MSIIETMTRRNGARTEPPPMQSPNQRAQHPVVGQHFEYVASIEEQLAQAKAIIEAQKDEIDTLQRDLAVERRERRNAQQARDEYHTRAVASETAVNNAAAILVDEVRRGREFAAERRVEPQPTAVAVDLDQMAANINEAEKE